MGAMLTTLVITVVPFLATVIGVVLGIGYFASLVPGGYGTLFYNWTMGTVTAFFSSIIGSLTSTALGAKPLAVVLNIQYAAALNFITVLFNTMATAHILFFLLLGIERVRIWMMQPILGMQQIPYWTLVLSSLAALGAGLSEEVSSRCWDYSHRWLIKSSLMAAGMAFVSTFVGTLVYPGEIGDKILPALFFGGLFSSVLGMIIFYLLIPNIYELREKCWDIYDENLPTGWETYCEYFTGIKGQAWPNLPENPVAREKVLMTAEYEKQHDIPEPTPVEEILNWVKQAGQGWWRSWVTKLG